MTFYLYLNFLIWTPFFVNGTLIKFDKWWTFVCQVLVVEKVRNFIRYSTYNKGKKSTPWTVMYWTKKVHGGGFPFRPRCVHPRMVGISVSADHRGRLRLSGWEHNTCVHLGEEKLWLRDLPSGTVTDRVLRTDVLRLDENRYLSRFTLLLNIIGNRLT